MKSERREIRWSQAPSPRMSVCVADYRNLWSNDVRSIAGEIEFRKRSDHVISVGALYGSYRHTQGGNIIPQLFCLEVAASVSGLYPVQSVIGPCETGWSTDMEPNASVFLHIAHILAGSFQNFPDKIKKLAFVCITKTCYKVRKTGIKVLFEFEMYHHDQNNPPIGSRYL